MDSANTPLLWFLDSGFIAFLVTVGVITALVWAIRARKDKNRFALGAGPLVFALVIYIVAKATGIVGVAVVLLAGCAWAALRKRSKTVAFLGAFGVLVFGGSLWFAMLIGLSRSMTPVHASTTPPVDAIAIPAPPLATTAPTPQPLQENTSPPASPEIQAAPSSWDIAVDEWKNRQQRFLQNPKRLAAMQEALNTIGSGDGVSLSDAELLYLAEASAFRSTGWKETLDRCQSKLLARQRAIPASAPLGVAGQMNSAINEEYEKCLDD